VIQIFWKGLIKFNKTILEIENMLLTRKQRWRKVRVRKYGHPADFEEAYANAFTGTVFHWDSNMKKMQRITTWNTVQPAKKIATSRRSQSYHFGDKRKRVSFDPSVKVVLIPSFHDFDAQTMERLWWRNEEFESFKHNAHQIWKLHGTLDYVEEVMDENDHFLVKTQQSSEVSGHSLHGLNDFSKMFHHQNRFSDEKYFKKGGIKICRNGFTHDHSNGASNGAEWGLTDTNMMDGKVINYVDKDFFMSQTRRTPLWSRTMKHCASTTRLHCEKSNLGFSLEIHPRSFSWPGHISDLAIVPEKHKMDFERFTIEARSPS